MSFTRKTTRSAIAIASAGALVLAGGSMAIASYSGVSTEGQVLACWTNNPSSLRIVDHFPCKSGENAISWNRRGIKGDAGADGAAGVSGVAGAIGNSGPAGAKGDSGAAGTGSAGAPGTDGSNGTNGSPGTDGSNGTDGLPGTTGSNGTDGSPGTTGSNGTDGLPGADGTNGENGLPGTDGTNGENGLAGKDGADGKNGVDGKNGIDGIVTDQSCPTGQFVTGVANGLLLCATPGLTPALTAESEPNDTPATADILSTTAPNNVTAAGGGTVDFYRFDLTTTQVMTADLLIDCSADTVLYLSTDDGLTPILYGDDSDNSGCPVLQQLLSPGTYYLEEGSCCTNGAAGQDAYVANRSPYPYRLQVSFSDPA